MNETEVAQVLALIEGSYPTFRVTDARIAAWLTFFSTQDAGQVLASVRQWCVTQHWPPAIADILSPLTKQALGWPAPDEAVTQFLAVIRSTSRGQGWAEGTHPAVRRTIRELGGTFIFMGSGYDHDQARRLFQTRYLAEYERALAQQATPHHAPALPAPFEGDLIKRRVPATRHSPE